MPIERKGGFLVDVDLAGRRSIGIESARIDECVRHAIETKADGVFGSPYFGFEQSDLNFLSNLPDLAAIWFTDIALDNVAGIYHLDNLLHFRVHPKRPGIDFSRLPSIEELIWIYNNKDTGIGALRNTRLFHIWHFNPKSKAFENMCFPKRVEELEITWANPATLSGIPKLPDLKRLGIHYCRNLESLSELPRIAPALQHLVVSKCKRVTDGEDVVELMPNLQHAHVQGKLLVTRNEN